MQFRLRNFMMAALTVFAIAFTGCDPEETTLEAASLEAVAQEGIDTVSVDGGEYSIAITTNRDWTITSSQEWVSVDPEKGSGNDIVTVTVLANDDAVRKATLTITASTKTFSVEIYQEGDGEGSWVVPVGSESIQGFYAATAEESYTLQDVVIDYQYENYNFVSAGGRTVLVYDDSVGESASVGDRVTLTGTVSVYFDVMQLQYPVTVDTVVASVTDITPLVVDVASFGSNYMDYQNQLVCFENVTISGTTITQADGSTTSYYNKLSTSVQTSGTYDVVGYAAQYSGAHQIYPVAFLAVGEGASYVPDASAPSGGTGSTDDGTGDSTGDSAGAEEVADAIYQEFFGTDAVSATTNLADFTDWSALGSGAANVTYSGSEKTTVRYTYVSDYDGASGTNNIFFGTGAPTYFAVENIAVTGVTSFSLSFGTIEGSSSTNGADGVAGADTFTVSYSIDGGTTYTEIPVEYSGASGWQYVTATFETAGSDAMNLKFETTLESVQRLDDILLIENK